MRYDFKSIDTDNSERHTPCKVTFGVRVVTHSSAEERLGWMFLWKCTSRVIIRYSRLNSVHPIMYLVNMSHLISAQVCLSCVSPVWGLRENTVSVESVLYIHVCALATWAQNVHTRAYPLLPLRKSPVSVSADLKEHLMLQCVTSDSSKSQMTERHRWSKSVKR